MLAVRHRTRDSAKALALRPQLDHVATEPTKDSGEAVAQLRRRTREAGELIE